MRCVFVTSVLLLAAGCSEEASSVSGPELPSAKEQVALAPISVNAVLPGGIELDVPSHLRSDRSVEGKAGVVRRRVVYELLEAGPEESEQVVSQVLARAGYVAGAPKKSKKGRYAIRYKKKGAPTINVTFYPALAKTPANPAARSMVAFSWKATWTKETEAANAGG